MKRLLEQSRYLVIIAVVAALVASAVVFAWGGYKTVQAIGYVFNNGDDASSVVVAFIKVMDILLIGMALLIFALAVYELFVEDLDLPEWLVIRDFQGLKNKLSGVAILVLGITFVEHLVEWQNALDTLAFAVAIVVVSAVLIIFRAVSEHG